MAEMNSTNVDGQRSAGALLTEGISSIALDTQENKNPVEDVDAFGSRVGDQQIIYQKKHTTASDSNLDFYSMKNNSGYAIIINNENFSSSTRMNKRTGTDIDGRNLQRIFRKLGFEVLLYKDRTCKELCEIIHHMAVKVDHTGNDCFVFAILSHGDDGCIYGTDGTVEIKDLVDQFRGDNCPSLAGKPKIFMFQACRGTSHEIPVPLADDVVDAVGGEEGPHIIEIDAGPAPTLPSASDFLFCYSVVEGFYSHRDTLFGSWYVQEFATAMERLVFKRNEAVDFLDVLTLVNKKVALRSVERSLSAASIGKKQMPCFLSMLTKKLYVTKKEAEK